MITLIGRILLVLLAPVLILIVPFSRFFTWIATRKKIAMRNWRWWLDLVDSDLIARSRRDLDISYLKVARQEILTGTISDRLKLYFEPEIKLREQLANSIGTEDSKPPLFGKIILCLFISPEKQQDRLADFEELYNTIWKPNFGPKIANLVYVSNALKSAFAIVKIGIVAAIADRVARALGW
jgi:hypothetical protein